MELADIDDQDPTRIRAIHDGQSSDGNRAEPSASVRAAGSAVRGDVAIIGMSCLFPGARNVDAYWRNILSKVNSITDPPPGAWDPATFYDPESLDSDKVYCKKGGYLADLAYFNPVDNAIPPRAVAGGEPDQWLSLQLARDALADAGYPELERAVRLRTSVILGKGTYLNAGNGSLFQHGMMVAQTLEILKTLHPEFTADQIGAVRDELKRSLPPLTPETVPGLVPNIIVGRIANKLDLMGPSYTVDAACASSLIAVQHAMRDLLTGECDLALVGGSQISTPVPTLNLFCQLGALSHRQELRPFDQDADGTILGEGIGLVVLKRLADAERDGDRIYAVVKGVGVASDGRGVSVMAPRIEGEVLALQRAYAAAGVSPRSVGLIEAHGTGTPVGDVVEIQALTQAFGGRNGQLPWCGIGSVKSMISHTMPAAGVAGLIKAALALHYKILPPTLNCVQPNPKLEIEKTPFYINTETRPWIHGGKEPRRAGVNAFGFGGINAHLVLEEYLSPVQVNGSRQYPTLASPGSRGPTSRATAGRLPPWDTEVCCFEGSSRTALVERLRQVERYLGTIAHDVGRPGQLPRSVTLADVAWTMSRELSRSQDQATDYPHRLTVVATSLVDLQAKLQKAAKRLEDPKCRQVKDASGIYYAERPLAREGKVALLFPGEGAQYSNMLADLCLYFPEVREEFDRIDRVYSDHKRGYVPSDYIFPRPAFSDEERDWAEQHLVSMSGAVESVQTANWAMYRLLSRLGVRPDAVVGHSSGEYSAIRAAEILPIESDEDLAHVSLSLVQSEETATNQAELGGAGLLAVGADRARVEAIAHEAGGRLFVAMDNCPHQAVLVGDRDAVDRACEVARRDGLIYEELSFDRPYHTPLFAPYLDHLRPALAGMRLQSGRLPTYSCTSTSLFPTDTTDILELLLDNWVRPVEFLRTVETMYAEGFRIFVEVGPNGRLTSFTEDILRGREFLAVASNLQRRSGITQLNHLLAILIAHGVEPDLTYLFAGRKPSLVTWDSVIRKAVRESSDYSVKVDTAFPLMHLSSKLAGELRDQLSSVDGTAAASVLPGSSDLPDAWSEAPAQLTIVETSTFSTPDEPSDSPVRLLEPFEDNHDPRTDAPNWAPTETGLVVYDAAGFAEDDGEERTTAVQSFLATMDQFLSVQEHVMQAYLTDGAGTQLIDPVSDVAGPFELSAGPAERSEVEPGPSLPLLGTVVSLVPGEQVVTERVYDLAEDLYLRDHTLGRSVSLTDPTLLALAVMPLTMSLEILAEAAAFLVPDRAVVGLKDVRANRWIAFESNSLTLRTTARRIPGTSDLVHVQIRNLTEDTLIDDPPKSAVIEAIVVFAESYQVPPAEQPIELIDARPSRWQSDRLYLDTMFHGPSWQGVAAIEQTGDNGTVATLPVLPTDGFFRSQTDVSFLLDPVVLDAAGQVIGFWTMEHLPTASLIFPFRLKTLEVFGGRRPTGELTTCQASIHLVGEQEVSSDIEVFDAQGRLWLRLVGWDDKRFDLPKRFYPFLLSPGRAEVSTPWPEAIATIPGGGSLQCRRVSAFTSDRGFWKRVWASCILSRTERQQFRQLRLPESRQLLWLAGRTAAKEAVLAVLRQEYGIELLPADVEIWTNEVGRPVVGGSWTQSVPHLPVVSISHTVETAVAVAGFGPDPGDSRSGGAPLLGIDLEMLTVRPGGFAAVAFSESERDVLAGQGLESVDEWLLRSWCAKEAVAKALGQGLSEGPGSVQIVELNQSTGAIGLQVTGRLAEGHSQLTSTSFIAHTNRLADMIVAVSICEPGDNYYGNYHPPADSRRGV
jgi:acyl transferase domain-containing protein/phosphopantetheinyl transferase (holo-ACP synthase)